MPPIPAEISQLVRSLRDGRSLLDLLYRRNSPAEILAHTAASGEVGAVPALVRLLAADRSLAAPLAKAIAELVHGITPAELSWVDEQLRRRHYDAWEHLTPEAVPRLAMTVDSDAAVLGCLSSHPNGYVRAAALEALSRCAGGSVIPFLALRANDWVEPVAARASDLLVHRIGRDHYQAVLDALPFLVRLLAQRRRNHTEIEDALRSVLISDGGMLSRIAGFDPSTRRTLYRLGGGEGTPHRRRFITVALQDPDSAVRMHAVGLLPSAPDIEDRAATLERLFGTDPFPGVRRQALAVISEHLPETVPGLFPRALLDRSAGVRSLARFVAHRHHVPVVPRDLYVERLSSTVATDVWVAIQGIGETGTRSDADLVMPFLDAGPPRLRAFALRALTRLEPDRALAPALDALADAASPVWIAGVNAIAANGRRADFEGLSVRMRSIANPRTRTRLLKILASAPKWDAAALLLDALRDPDEVVRAAAAGWVDAWVGDFNHSQVPPTSRQLERIHALLSAVADRMPPETVNRLRFSLRP